jgi:hypothetical protein
VSPARPIDAVAREATWWLRRQLELAGLAGTMSVRLVNPRTQGFVYGFITGLGAALEATAAQRHELEARVFIGLFEGSPMGEMLGVEALQLGRLMASGAGDPALAAPFRATIDEGARGARCFVEMLAVVDAFRETLT